MKRRAFISVYDKVGLIDFVKNLVEQFDYEIVATKETAEFLKNAELPVTSVDEYSPTLNVLPNVYVALNEITLAGIIADNSDIKELNALEKAIIKPFDMVVVNLCPFDKIIAKCDERQEILKKIDVVGCTILRAAAKNCKNVTVISDKLDYYVALSSNEFGRLKLAAKAFGITANYDKQIVSYLEEQTGETTFKAYNFERVKDLKHGENPHQKAVLYKNENIVDYEVLFGKELSYNDILDITEAIDVVSEFYDVNCVATVRHGKPCGVALGRSLYEAYTKAFDCDPVSSFYGVVGVSKPVDGEVAKYLNSMSVEVVIAPDYDKEALELFEDNKEIKLVKINTPLKEYKAMNKEEITISPFGVLIQERNNSELDKNTFKVVTREKPTTEQIEDAVFAWKVAKYAKTNAVVIARDFKCFAISQGHTNVPAAFDSALSHSCDNSKDSVLASDTVIQSEDCIHAAIQNRVSLIIQPGGSPKDKKLIEVCNKYGIAMITTGIRNYKH